MTTALLIIDMQVGSFTPRTARFDTAGLVERLNSLAARVRASDGLVVFIQHEGPPGDPHHPAEQGHKLLPELEVTAGDRIVGKKSCDSFLNTDLDGVLRKAGATELVITGCATDYCVDTTVKSALGRGWKTTAPSDGHTTGTDRPHLAPQQIIAHHNFVWADFLSPAGAARVCPCADLFPERPR